MIDSYLKNRKIEIVVLITLLVIAFIMFGHRHREKVQLYLKGSLYETEKVVFDWWSVSHLVYFAILGYIIPEYHFTFMMIGILWEVFEDWASADATTKLADCKNPLGADGKRRFWCNGFQDDYWYGKWDDVFSNIVGYIIGSGLRTTFPI
jgi:hypothetical protein